MNNQVEGILINKYPYQEKNLIGHVLLRNGMKLSVIFYGGLGGGTKRKSSILQIGYLFKIVLGNTKKKSFEILNAKEYSEKWYHESIATDPKAFYILCFFCEFIEKFSPVAAEPSDLELDYDAHNGLFRLLSNALFHLENITKNGNADCDKALFIFLSKALYELGIFPRTEVCSISGSKISDTSQITLIPENGGFAFMTMVAPETQRKKDGAIGMIIRREMLKVVENKYGLAGDLDGVNINCCRELLEYICFQQNVHLKDFKTASMIF